MSKNPFLRGFDKLSIQLIVYEPRPGSTLCESSYVIHAQDQDQSLVIGAQPTLERAQHIVQRLRFETGHFSRCWEISAEHLPAGVISQLFLMCTDLHALQLEFFQNANQNVIGCKLRNTPWTGKHLDLLDTSPTLLRQRQLEFGLAPEFVEILHLAGQADVRFLLFDPEARCSMGCRSLTTSHNRSYSPASISRSEGLHPMAVAIRQMLRKVTLRSPRSILPMWERSITAASAKASCESAKAVRRARIAAPSFTRSRSLSN